MNPFNGSLGVFDSGVGGLTVVKAILERNPRERVLYVADQAHVPYGGRPLEEIHGFAGAISEFLAAMECRAIVMACNISSAVALPSVTRDLAPLPVFGMIKRAAQRAVEKPGARVGVLATEGTVKSGAYESEIRRLDPSAVVIQVACPRLVPLVEIGATDSAEAEEAAREYLIPLTEAGVDSVILGCTHYPFLLPVLTQAAAKLAPNSIRFIDPAIELAEHIPPGNSFSLLRDEPLTLLTTGSQGNFADQVPQFLPEGDSRVGIARWNTEGKLCLAMAERVLETLPA